MANALKRKRAAPRLPLDVNGVLALLARRGDLLSISEITGQIQTVRPRRPGYAGARRNVIGGIGQLLRQGFVVRVKEGDEARYRVTPEGRAFHRAGNQVERQPSFAIRKDSFPAKVWKTLRIVRKATIPDLVEVAAADTSTEEAIAKACARARQFILGLKRAGVVAELPIKDGRFERFALVRDLGPLSPICRAAGIFDRNTRETIPYADAKR